MWKDTENLFIGEKYWKPPNALNTKKLGKYFMSQLEEGICLPSTF